jgi:hypothetical protein
VLQDKTTYSLDIKRQELSPFVANSNIYKKQDNYAFDERLSRYGWNGYTQYNDFIFQGSENYNSQAISPLYQNYSFTGANIANVGYSEWNYTYTNNSNSTWNRALGTTASTTSPSSFSNQANNSNNATSLIGGSNILGLQAINFPGNSNYNDTNTNRPQLNPQYRKIGDLFDDAVTDDSTTNNISGARARTG